MLFFCHTSRYISGSMHYSRVPPFYWRDRLEKLHAAGLNAVQTYVPWNFHETEPGTYDFSGGKNLVEFIKIVQNVGLLVILRAGPYIDAEWEMGGLPSWLLRFNRSIALRTSDPLFLSHVDRWMGVLLPTVAPLLYENGGPIISVQVENEYGSYYACDKNYLSHLVSTFRQHLGDSVILFSTDGDADGYLKCGTVASLYATVDFGIGVAPEQAFKSQRDYEPHGPLVNSEFYTGWLDFWGRPHQRRNATQVADSLDAILKVNASVNMYMFEGGTNFGFWNGADISKVYSPVPTSYDYDAPLTEAGDTWEKYMLIRDVISKYQPVPGQIPGPTEKREYGKVTMTEYAPIFNTSLATRSLTADNPVTMEDLMQDFGFILYNHSLTKYEVGDRAENATLCMYGLRDRALVYVGPKVQGIGMRTSAQNSTVCLEIVTSPLSELRILVENMGRIDYGSFINDSKGILHGVTLSGKSVHTWSSMALPLNNTSDRDGRISYLKLTETVPRSATFYRGVFTVDARPADTFLSVDGWTKGQAFVNDFNLGRYWPAVGPQKTLYVPASLLRVGTNTLVLFEVDSSPCFPPFDACYASLVKTPDIGMRNP